MLPLSPGPGNFNKNMKELTEGKVGPARKKAIATIAKKHGISEEEAKRHQAVIIAKSQYRKR